MGVGLDFYDIITMAVRVSNLVDDSLDKRFWFLITSIRNGKFAVNKPGSLMEFLSSDILYHAILHNITNSFLNFGVIKFNAEIFIEATTYRFWSV